MKHTSNHIYNLASYVTHILGKNKRPKGVKNLFAMLVRFLTVVTTTDLGVCVNTHTHVYDIQTYTHI